MSKVHCPSLWLCSLPACPVLCFLSLTLVPVDLWANTSTSALDRPLTAWPPPQELLRLSIGVCSITHAILALASMHLFLPPDPLLLWASSLDFAVTKCVVFAAIRTVLQSDWRPAAALSSTVATGAEDRPCPMQSCPCACLCQWVRECALACSFCSQCTTHLPEQQINTNSLFLWFNKQSRAVLLSRFLTNKGIFKSWASCK